MSPPYAEIRAAERRAQKANPDCDRVHGVWTPGGEHEVVVEVWTDGHAKVVAA